MKMFFANWKMNKNVQDSLSFCTQHIEQLKLLKHKLILCPQAPALTVMLQLLQDTDVALCGQSTSEHTTGAFTGQIAATTLAQAGCTYVLVGHSEERKAFELTNQQVAQKALRVLEAGMIPVVCVGEPEEIYKKETTESFLLKQLEPIQELLQEASIYVAYEPMWAIGSGKTPTFKELNNIFEFLKHQMGKCAFLYGGSVNIETIDELNKLEQICGYLVGSASLDFNKLEGLMQKI
jgi:triosephosphate isomerase